MPVSDSPSQQAVTGRSGLQLTLVDKAALASGGLVVVPGLALAQAGLGTPIMLSGPRPAAGA